MINEEGLKKIIQEQITFALDLSKYDLSTDSVLSIYKFVKDKLDAKIIEQYILADRKNRDITSLSEEEEQMVISLIESGRENGGEISSLVPIPDKILAEINRRLSINPDLLKNDASISGHR